jgi:penicillin-binding protein 2
VNTHWPSHSDLERPRYLARLRFAGVGTVLLLLVLLLRLFWLQVVQHDHYRGLAENNRIALIPTMPPRGVIHDRSGEVLASNYSDYTLEITPSKTGGLEATLARLGEVVSIEAGDLKRFRKILGESRRFESIPIRQRLSEVEIARFVANRYRFPGVEVRARMFRQYPQGESFSHVVGYIGRINEDDVRRLEREGRLTDYRGADHIGKLGIEKRYEDLLHGRAGIQQVEVNSAGKPVRTLAQTASRPGHNLYLHIDAQLQRVAEAAFGQYRGALVALDPNNGGVLALVSRPGFDPNLFIDGVDQETWRTLNDAFRRPLINRALRGVYPPGSTIKPFMALAGLELGYRRPGDSIRDPGYFSLPNSSHRYRDWRPEGHGVVDLKQSIVLSCDTYYYRLAHEMGVRNLHQFLGRFGFGRAAEIDLDGELTGLVPNPEWKQRRFRQPWWPGETVIAGIGQGYMLATPLQLAVATQAIANRGVIYRPRLVRAWHDPISGRREEAAPEILHRLDLKSGNLDLVRQAMVEVMLPGGTAAVAGLNAGYAFAGKTGTAQVKSIRQGERYDARRLAEWHRDHALFIAFAPAEAPRIVLAVMVENGGSGSGTAAPIARKVIDYWLLGKLPAAPAVAVASETPPAAPEEGAHAAD